MSDSFWTGGRAAQRSALREQYDESLRELQLKLDGCTADQRETIEQQIDALRTDFRKQVDANA